MAQICKTNGAVYEIDINARERAVSCKVHLPPTVTLFKQSLSTSEWKALEQRIHDAMEGALAPIFPALTAGDRGV